MVPCSCTRPMRTGRSGSQESLIWLRPANFCRQCLCTLCHSQVCRRAVCRKSHFLPPIATFFKCHFFDLSAEENRGIGCERQDRKRTQVWMVQIRSQTRRGHSRFSVFRTCRQKQGLIGVPNSPLQWPNSTGQWRVPVHSTLMFRLKDRFPRRRSILAVLRQPSS